MSRNPIWLLVTGFLGGLVLLLVGVHLGMEHQRAMTPTCPAPITITPTPLPAMPAVVFRVYDPHTNRKIPFPVPRGITSIDLYCVGPTEYATNCQIMFRKGNKVLLGPAAMDQTPIPAPEKPAPEPNGLVLR